jgi:hypothetical protein
MAEAFSDRMNETGVPENEASAPTGMSRALVPLTLPKAAAAGPDCVIRPDARFVVQLIATAGFAPQTRALRRANSDDATATYAGANARSAVPVAANGTDISLVA